MTTGSTATCTPPEIDSGSVISAIPDHGYLLRISYVKTSAMPLRMLICPCYRLEVYTTYAIVDPKTRLLVYIGQTNDFERRCNEHRRTHRKSKLPRNSVKAWLKRLHQAGHAPKFLVLEVVETEAESLESEIKWVEKIAALGHPLYNRWDEHKELIEAAESAVGQSLVAFMFDDGKPVKIGKCEPNAKQTGYRVHIDKGIRLSGPVVLDLLPQKT